MALWQRATSLLNSLGFVASLFLAGCGGSPPSTANGIVTSATTDPLQYVKAFNADAGDLFGYSVALSADGRTLAVGAPNEGSIATGVDGDPGNHTTHAGAVYVFARSGDAWVRQAYLKASNTGSGDRFGYSIAISADGRTLAVGAIGEASNARGVGGADNDSAQEAGAVYVFVRDPGGWRQQEYVKASNTGALDQFGHSVALSASGDRLAVGAYRESSDVTGVNSLAPDNDAARQAGAVYVFRRQAAAWSQEAYIKAGNTKADDWFGWSVALSPNGNRLAVGAVNESTDGNPAHVVPLSGAVYVFAHNGVAWSEQAYVKASTIDAFDQFGSSVALSDDGDTLAVGATNEDSIATGIDGHQGNDPAGSDAGAAYVFAYSAGAWNQQAYVKASNTGRDDFFGTSVALSGDGNRLAVGAFTEASNATGINGNQLDNSAPEAGAAYVFSRSGGHWRQSAYVKASNTRATSWFGQAIGMSSDGRVLAVGAPRENSNGSSPSDASATDVGAVYVVSLPN